MTSTTSFRLIPFVLLFFCACGEAALRRAAADGDLRTVKAHLRDGASPDMRDGCGWTLLHIATFYQQRPMARYLPEEGASVNATTRDYPTRCTSYSPIPPGSTPLMIAAYFGYADMVSVLLDRGARVSARNSEGYTALAYAEKFGFDEVADRLEDHGAMQAASRTYEKPPRLR